MPSKTSDNTKREGLAEGLRQLIRVALTNPDDLAGFIQANYPHEFEEFSQPNKKGGQ